MKRGELWTAATGHGFGSKPRPALILTADVFASATVVLVAPLTTFVADAQLVRPSVEPSEGNGLLERSQVMVDQIMPVRRDKLGRRIGHLSPADLQQVDRSILLYMGLA